MKNDLQALSNQPLPLPVPWRDPNQVSPGQLAVYIGELESACALNPQNAALRTCLGMAQAMNLDVYRALDSLETATKLDDEHFWAQLKFAELHYRLRALPFAEEQTQKALNLATNSWELSIARRQLQEIRRLMRDGTQKPAWTRPLEKPAILLTLFFMLVGVAYLWR